jgi:hypothetical protein
MSVELLGVTQNRLAAWWREHPEIPCEVLVDRIVEFCWTGLEGCAASAPPR